MEKLESGDVDFIPTAKFARREGVQFVLDTPWRDIPSDPFEQIHALTSGFPGLRRADV